MLKAGFILLIATNGEEVTYNNVKVKAIVNRSITAPKDSVTSNDGKLDFSLSGVSTIEILRSLISEPPVGVSMVDSLGNRHRISRVTSSEITWMIYCIQSKAGV